MSWIAMWGRLAARVGHRSHQGERQHIQLGQERSEKTWWRRWCSAESGKMSRCLSGAPGEESSSRTEEEHQQRQAGLEGTWHIQGRAGLCTWDNTGRAEAPAGGGWGRGLGSLVFFPTGNGGPLNRFKYRCFRWQGCVDVIPFAFLENCCGYALWRLN